MRLMPPLLGCRSAELLFSARGWKQTLCFTALPAQSPSSALEKLSHLILFNSTLRRAVHGVLLLLDVLDAWVPLLANSPLQN